MKMKVKCTGYKQNERFFTLGNIYEWVDGKLRSDNGWEYDAFVQGEDPAKWGLSHWYTFEKVIDDENTKAEMSNEEIWDMLVKKMRKNGIVFDLIANYSDCLYSEETLQKAVALAYKCGYMRAQKGRPFKYGEKKTKERNFVKDKDGHKIFYEDDAVLEVGTKVVFIDNGSSGGVWPVHGTVGVVDMIINNEELRVHWLGGEDPRHNWVSYCKKVVD